MIVYHGSNITVSKPDINLSYRPPDSGKGFYMTSIREQTAGIKVFSGGMNGESGRIGTGISGKP